ncbi:MAG: hypothetical protein GY877_09050 [Hyphomicrobium sp.]|nr:hypothetical protein [Hyphomicrobium sp.]
MTRFVPRAAVLIIIGFVTSICGFATITYAQYFDYDPDNPAEQAPITPGEKPVIPLDTEDPTYNLDAAG